MRSQYIEPAVHVGPGSLPPDFDDGLLKGAIYSLRVQSAPTRFGIINHALRDNLARGLRCTLITPVPLEDFIRYADQETIRIFQQGLSDKTLTILSMIGDYSANIFRFGAERFIRELEALAIPEDGFLVIDHADALFTAEDTRVAARQAEIYRGWMRKTRSSALFLFLYSGSEAAAAGYLQCLSDYFSGLAGLYISPGGLEVAVDYWGVQRGVIMAKRLTISASEGGLHVQPSLVVNRRCAPRAGQDDASIRRLRFPGSDHAGAAERGGSSSRMNASPEETAQPRGGLHDARHSQDGVSDPGG